MQAISLALGLVSSRCAAASGAFFFVFFCVCCVGFFVVGVFFYISAQAYQLPKRVMEVFFMPLFRKIGKNDSVHLLLTSIPRNLYLCILKLF